MGGSGVLSAAVCDAVTGSSCKGGDEHPGRLPRITMVKTAHSAIHRGAGARRRDTKGTDRSCCMGLILLEALLALIILIVIVWWTMFSGRKKGELPGEQDRERD